MKRESLFWIAILTGVLSALVFVAVAAAATPIIGGSSFGTAVSISPNTEYSASINNTSHTSDYFTFNAVPGQIVTVVFTSTTTFNSSGFYLYDQSHISSLAYKGVNGTEQTFQFMYMGNNTTPTKYYFVVMNPGSGSNAYTFRYEVGAQTDGGQTGDAGDTSGTARVITPGANTMYANNLLGFTDRDDWYRVNVVSGQIITATLIYDAYDGDPNYTPTLFYTVLDQTGTHSLASRSLAGPSGVQAVYRWISSNTEPSAYYFHLSHNGSKADLVHYSLQVQLGRQVDAGQPGDAGDTSGTARVITPGANTMYANNLLGFTDRDDWYRVNAVSGQIITATITYDAYDGDLELHTHPILYGLGPDRHPQSGQ